MTLTVAASARRRLTPPYNGTELSVPTPDGTGSTLHPSVVDMGEPWNGWRYWMAHTPYHNGNVQLENPCIAVSSDGLNWQEPDGITNPIDPWPGGSGYNSDTELAYDPDGDRLICYWRDYKGGSGTPGNLVFCAAWSEDGVTWSEQIDLIAMTFPDSGGMFSPAVWRVGPGEWRAWFIAQTGPTHLYTASGPLGPWTGPVDCTFDGTNSGSVTGPWHGDVVRGTDSVYRFILNAPYVNSGAGSDIYVASSLDGIEWSDLSLVISHRPTEWDRRIYRPTMLTYGGLARCWYSAYRASDGQPRIGHTVLPISLWPEPPTT